MDSGMMNSVSTYSEYCCYMVVFFVNSVKVNNAT